METSFVMEEHILEQVRIAKDVFGNMVDMSIEPLDGCWEPQSEVVTAAVYFTAPWQGALFVECNVELAFAFTAKLMAVETPTSVDDDVCDAMGELANMIGGNLKALMPANVGISIPSIIRGKEYAVRLRGGRRLSSTVFDSEFGKFCLTLLGTGLASA
jgi:CheY-specific phosphatase CheX